MRFPRTLVLSPCVFNFENGGGVTFSNLFRGFPQEALANLHSSAQQPDFSVCKNFYRLGNREIVRPWPFGLKKEPTLGSSPTESAIASRPSLKSRLAGNSGMPQHFCLTPELDFWLGQFKPEIIYTILGPIPHLEAILAIKEKYGCKLVVHCMDDWHNQAYTSGIFRYQRRKMARLLHEIIHSADLCLAIGSAMARNFSDRYQREFLPFQNTINTEEFLRQARGFRSRPSSGHPKKSLLYYGSVFPFAQLDSLNFTAQALEGTDWELVARTTPDGLAHLAAAAESKAQIRLELIEKGPDDFPRQLAQADALLLPANFDRDSIEFLRFSMPTKVPGYMMSETPVVYLGPAEIAQGRYALEDNWAFCVVEREAAPLRAALAEISGSGGGLSQAARTKVEKAKSTAQKNHDEKIVRTSFQELLCNLK